MCHGVAMSCPSCHARIVTSYASVAVRAHGGRTCVAVCMHTCMRWRSTFLDCRTRCAQASVSCHILAHSHTCKRMHARTNTRTHARLFEGMYWRQAFVASVVHGMNVFIHTSKHCPYTCQHELGPGSARVQLQGDDRAQQSNASVCARVCVCPCVLVLDVDDCAFTTYRMCHTAAFP